MNMKSDLSQPPNQIPNIITEYFNHSTAIHMASGEFTYITPWSVDYHPRYGLVFRDRTDTRNQKPGGTLAAKMYRVGEVFALDLTALSVDDLSHLANPRTVSDEDIESIVVFKYVLWPTSDRLQLSHLDTATDYDRQQISNRKEFNSIHQHIFGTSYTFANDEWGWNESL